MGKRDRESEVPESAAEVAAGGAVENAGQGDAAIVAELHAELVSLRARVMALEVWKNQQWERRDRTGL